ncbi:hypothetical protein GKE82_18870 [Conexibacter sp. W3-3-2]|uniref:hypothetical protein n=1 Tax=Conexibacter sp. W3-3-2 TaxID=2675227 RepID=UPI0012B8E1CB|nr:hypothetical protein [Conexibacter sp. W3-3-2]MTD46291.1 hypothetical protein [Conexibacter sp. W3-3-2]
MGAETLRSTTYAGSYVHGLDGSERAQLTCTTSGAGGATTGIVLASGPRAILDWETTADRATIAAAVLGHWLGRPPCQADLHEFLDEVAGDWVAGQPWQLTGEQLEQAGFQP